MEALNKYRHRAYNLMPPGELMPFNNDGWIQPEFSSFFTQAMKAVLCKGVKNILVLEVGSWMGLSTRLMADYLKNNSVQGTVVAIDTWLGSPEHIGDEKLETLYEQFVSNVRHKGLEDRIIPFRISSVQAAHYLKSKAVYADIVYIDAGHEYEAVKLDISVFWTLLKPGGFMLLDDYAWEGVKKAADEHSRNCNVPLQVSGALAMLQKPYNNIAL
jgi:predicted O-methyltransferase YrrM